MKKLVISLIIVLLTSASAFCGNFEDIKEKAEQGDVQAQYNLGVMYAEGNGITQNTEKAFKWYKRAAKQGFEKAQFYLGFMYSIGNGVSQDLQKAYVWFDLAAKQGNKDALEMRETIAQDLPLKDLSVAKNYANQLKKEISEN